MKKLIYLEGLRGTAALFVVLSHFVQVFFPALFDTKESLAHNSFELVLAKYPTNIFYNGHFSVCLFFVLSGYVLSIKYFQKKDIEIVYSSFVKRYLRLAIPVVSSILFAYILLLANSYFFGEIITITKSTMPDPYSVNHHSVLGLIKLAFFDVFMSGANYYNPVLWTMKIELWGSFLVFFALPLFGAIKKWSLKLPMYLIFILLIMKTIGFLFVPFILGMLLCDLKLNKFIVTKLNNTLTNLPLLAAGLFLASFPYIDTEGTMYDFLRLSFLEQKGTAFLYYHVLGAFLLLAVMVRSSIFQQFFSKKLFDFLGKISFSLYLTHFIVLCSLSSFLFKSIYNSGLSYNLSFLITFMVSLPIMFSIAYVMFRYIDVLAIKTTTKMYTKIFKPVYHHLRNRNEGKRKNVA